VIFCQSIRNSFERKFEKIQNKEESKDLTDEDYMYMKDWSTKERLEELISDAFHELITTGPLSR
jgi:hypothetical protein